MPTATIDRDAARRASADIDRICDLELPVEELLGRTSTAVRKVVPFDACFWSAMDPATTMPAFGGHTENMEATCGVYWDYEYLVADFNKFVDVARARRGASTLVQATGGRPERSARHREINAKLGCEPELRAVFGAATSRWGLANLLRETGSPGFSEAEVGFVERISQRLGEGLRSTLLSTPADPERRPEGPGMLLFDERGELTSLTPEAEARLAEIGTAHRMPTELGVGLPIEAYAVVVRARAVATGRGTGVPRARVRTTSGQWLLLQASCLREDADGARQTALSIEPAKVSEIAPMVIEAYGLSEREREVTELIARGLQTDAIAAQLTISPHTVRDHVKAVFEKIGARNRGELVAKIFSDHYHPNLERALGHRPVDA